MVNLLANSLPVLQMMQHGTYKFLACSASVNLFTLTPQEFPFYTLTSLPANLLLYVGGVVSAHSVKLLDKINNPDEPETRDAWWLEVRNEIRSHAKAMGCNAVIAYTESTSIW